MPPAGPALHGWLSVRPNLDGSFHGFDSFDGSGVYGGVNGLQIEGLAQGGNVDLGNAGIAHEGRHRLKSGFTVDAEGT